MKSWNIKLGQLRDRLSRLTDAYIDRLIDREVFENRKTTLLMEQKDFEEKLSKIKAGNQSGPDELKEFLELVKTLQTNYKLASTEEKRDLLKKVTSNRFVERKNVDIALTLPYQEVAKRWQNANSTPQRDIPRTWDRLIKKLLKFFIAEQESELEPELAAD